MAGKAKRNDPCPCGSGKKYKKCCLKKDLEEAASQRKIRATHLTTYKPKRIAKAFENIIAQTTESERGKEKIEQLKEKIAKKQSNT